MSQVHIDKFWSCFARPPTQQAVGDSPQVYLEKLNELCSLNLAWPKAHPTGSLTRDQLRKLCCDSNVDVLIAYAAVMAWGGRGKNTRNYRLSLSKESRKPLVNILKELRTSTRSREDDFAAMQQAAEKITGLGISFYTKLLFFFRKEADAYILDQFTAKSANMLLNPCPVGLTTSGYPDPVTDAESYEWFCAALEDLGKSHAPVQWSGEQVETAMFDVHGGTWRKHVRSIYSKPGPKKIRKNTPARLITAPPILTACHRIAAIIAKTHADAFR